MLSGKKELPSREFFLFYQIRDKTRGARQSKKAINTPMIA